MQKKVKYAIKYMNSDELRKMQLIQLELLEEVDRICTKYGISYSVEGGTLLGTVRHKGFIPWDDDMDFCMLRNDFYKLLEIADKEFQHPYFFQTALSDRRYF